MSQALALVGDGSYLKSYLSSTIIEPQIRFRRLFWLKPQILHKLQYQQLCHISGLFRHEVRLRSARALLRRSYWLCHVPCDELLRHRDVFGCFPSTLRVIDAAVCILSLCDSAMRPSAVLLSPRIDEFISTTQHIYTREHTIRSSI